VRALVASAALTMPIGTALLTGTDDEIWFGFGAACSTTLPQVWHSPQRPTQRLDLQPHSVQAWLGLALVLGMPETLRETSDTDLRAEPLRQAQDGAFDMLRTALVEVRC
jgi:hypothetical protein